MNAELSATASLVRASHVLPVVPTGPATGVALRAATSAGGRFQPRT